MMVLSFHSWKIWLLSVSMHSQSWQLWLWWHSKTLQIVSSYLECFGGGGNSVAGQTLDHRLQLPVKYVWNDRPVRLGFPFVNLRRLDQMVVLRVRFLIEWDAPMSFDTTACSIAGHDMIWRNGAFIHLPPSIFHLWFLRACGEGWHAWGRGRTIGDLTHNSPIYDECQTQQSMVLAHGPGW